MKKGLIFATTLALALSVGVAVGAHQAKAQKVEAATDTTLYYAVETTYTVKCNVNRKGDGDDWMTYNMTKTDDKFGGVPVYTVNFTDLYDGLGCIQFQLYDGDNWHSQEQAFGPKEWKSASVYNGKIWNDKQWKTYTPDGDDPVDPPAPVEKDYYLVGSFNNWTESDEYKLTVDAEDANKYTIADVELAAEAQMKVKSSDNEWYGVAEIYEGCGWTVGNNGNCVVTSADTYTVNFYVNSENGNHIQIIGSGVEPQPVEKDYYLVGSFNNWTESDEYKLTVDAEDANKYTMADVELAAEAQMKVKSSANEWYGVAEAYEGCGWTVGDDGNCVVTSAGTYTVNFYVNSENGNHIQLIGGEEPQPVDENYYLKGDFNEWQATEQYKFTADAEDANHYVLEDVEIEAGQGMKAFKAPNSWYGVAEAYEGCGWTVGEGEDAGNCIVTNAGTYTVNLYVSSENGNHLTIDAGEEPQPVEEDYYLKGDFNDWEVSEQYKFTVDAEDANHYILEDVEIAAGQGMKGFKAPNSWYGVAEAYEGCGWTVGEGEDAGNCIVTNAGTYTVNLYVNSENGNHLTIDAGEVPPTPSAYTMKISGSEVVYTLVENPTNPDEVQTNEEELAFTVGQTVTFYKDGEAIEVEPKDDPQLTKVYGVEGSVKFAQAYDGDLYLSKSANTVWAGQFTPGFYLAGSFEGWAEKLALPAQKQEEANVYYIENLELEANTEYQFISAPEEGNEISWYGAAADRTSSQTGVKYEVLEGGNFKVLEAGTFNIYFNNDEGWYSIENAIPAVYTLQVGETEYELELNHDSEYKIKDHINVKLTAGEEVKVLKDGVDAEFARKKIGNNNLDENFKVIATVNEQVYVDLSAETVFVAGLDFGGYHMLRNDEFIHMTKNDNPMEGFIEYYSEMISFKKDDVVRFIDTSAENDYARIFDITQIDKASAEGFSVVEGKLVAQQDVQLAVYLKLQYENDQVYFGPVPEEVALAEKFAEEFNDAMEGVCTWDNKTNLTELGEAWQAQVTKFNALDKKVKDYLKAATKESSINEIAEFVGKYEYIAAKYGEEVLGEGYNFLEKDLSQAHVMPYVTGDTFDSNNNTMIIVISAIAATTAIALGVLLVLKKRKHQ